MANFGLVGYRIGNLDKSTCLKIAMWETSFLRINKLEVELPPDVNQYDVQVRAGFGYQVIRSSSVGLDTVRVGTEIFSDVKKSQKMSAVVCWGN